MKATAATRLLVLMIALSVGPAARADVVTEWNAVALNAIRADRTPPPVASRALAILHASIYDAVNGIERTHESYFVPSAVPAAASREAAASAAARRALAALFPDHARSFDELSAALLAAVPEGPRKSRGVAWGESVADQILSRRADDGSAMTLSYSFDIGPGVWRPTPPAFALYLLPHWGLVTPFAIPGGSAFRPPGPPPLDSAKYLAEYEEVKTLGAAVGSTRTPEQSLIALFWADGPGTETPPGHWNSIARHVAARRGNTVEENARLFALLNIAMADAAVCAWDAKYTYRFWRPVTAIRDGDDPAWSPFINTPPFPDYVSGHSTFSGAASTVLAMFYGTDDIAFTTGSDFLPGVTRRFDSFSAAAVEAAVSRLYGGIHFRSANEDGLAAGVRIGAWAFEHHLRPKGDRSRK